MYESCVDAIAVRFGMECCGVALHAPCLISLLHAPPFWCCVLRLVPTANDETSRVFSTDVLLLLGPRGNRLYYDASLGRRYLSASRNRKTRRLFTHVLVRVRDLICFLLCVHEALSDRERFALLAHAQNSFPLVFLPQRRETIARNIRKLEALGLISSGAVSGSSHLEPLRIFRLMFAAFSAHFLARSPPPPQLILPLPVDCGDTRSCRSECDGNCRASPAGTGLYPV